MSCCAIPTPRCMTDSRCSGASRYRPRGNNMFLSNFSIRQPVTTVAIVIVLMCLGLLAIKNLKVNSLPDVQEPVLVVSVPYPGASPESVEREIINRIEKPLQSVPQVREIRSTANEGSAQIIVIFKIGRASCRERV